MADQKPPRLARGERDTMLSLLQYQRESVVRKVEDLDDAAACRELVPSGTTLLWLVQHLAHAESLWVEQSFAGEDVELAPPATLAAAIDAYRATWSRVDAIVAASASLDEPCRRSRHDEPVNLRWILAHLLEETARHAGHADILREQLDGRVGR